MPPFRLSRNSVRIIGHGVTPLNPRISPNKGSPSKITPSVLMQQALQSALHDAKVESNDLDGLIAVPNLHSPHFMEAHYLATQIGLLPGRSKIVRTMDTGGAGPITALLEAKRMIMMEGADLVAVVAGDAVKNLSGEEFLRRADRTCNHPEADLPSPVIPNGYDRVARYQMKNYGTTRDQLAACSALMSIMASRHPLALTRQPRTIEEILSARHVAPVTSVLECARRADGGAAILVASSNFLARKGLPRDSGVVVIGGGEASGPLYPPKNIEDITEDMFSCEEAAGVAYDEAQVGPQDIDFFGLYDCFPICLIRAVEAVGIAPKGHGGAYIEERYYRIVEGLEKDPDGFKPQDIFPINTHGGLLAYAAPWETPAMFNIVEAVEQLTHRAGSARQIRNARRALVYGNGGIFSASAVAILGSGRY